MKKIATILLICVYAFTTMGFNFKHFYCCGKLQSITITLTTSEKHYPKSNNDQCCKNKYQYFKIKDNHVGAHNITLPVKHFSSLHFYYLTSTEFIFKSQKNTIAYRSNAPPLYDGIPVYISNCVFRI